MRADRLLSILWLLMSEQRWTAAELADRLEVSTRTVLRDVESLSAAGVPVYCERGRAGGVRLLPGFRTRVTGLNDDEVRAVFLALAAPAPATDLLGRGSSLASGMRKLVAALPSGDRLAASEVTARLVIDPEGWLPRRRARPLEPLLDAALTDRRVDLTYRSRRSRTTWRETVDAYGLLAAGGSWYLVAGRSVEPVFLLADRILDAAVLDEGFDRPAGLDLHALWQERRAAFRQGTVDPLVVAAVLAPDRLADAGEWAAGVVDRGTGDGNGEPPGWHRVDLDFGSPDHAFGVLHRLGGKVRVLDPLWLAERLTAEAERVLAAYRDQNM